MILASQSRLKLQHLFALFFTLLLSALPTHAEQVQKFKGHEIHYIVFPSTVIQPKIAGQYAINRGRDRAVINIAVLDKESNAVSATLSGSSANLIGQPQNLEFQEIREAGAIYYLAQIRHSDQEIHKITIEVDIPKVGTATLNFQQKLYWEE
ncbi:MAG TPA: DUF4426 domain-containing protein [Gammaproteobacteria bacterium]|nr:DUF4426 domain-containing protein [Gammaproteobacteria bacterium]|tara:strand:- start:4021 stop:4476 length:456 start_codon:yes stop_codon:yes gene_type:complete